jgi:hypothetical protein
MHPASKCKQADERDELAPFHSITSSASARRQRRQLYAERSRRSQVDDELELGRPLDRQVGRFFAPEDATDIGTNLANRVGEVRSIAHQPAGFGIRTQRIDHGYRVTRCQSQELSVRLKSSGVIGISCVSREAV